MVHTNVSVAGSHIISQKLSNRSTAPGTLSFCEEVYGYQLHIRKASCWLGFRQWLRLYFRQLCYLETPLISKFFPVFTTSRVLLYSKKQHFFYSKCCNNVRSERNATNILQSPLPNNPKILRGKRHSYTFAFLLHLQSYKFMLACTFVYSESQEKHGGWHIL